MPLTSEERRAINRENARRSTGPKSAEGKARSRTNALKHGLCSAVSAALPDEDPEAIQTRADEWNAYYRPRSPAARQLVEDCALATLRADRCDRHLSAALARLMQATLSDQEDGPTDDDARLIA